MPELSVFITTFNNAATIGRCLDSVSWADEVLVLDSFSTDDTVAIARARGARVEQHEFLGYGPQKQLALEHTTRPWVLLLDADEALTGEAAARVREVMAGEPDADGYALPRVEQMFWRLAHPSTRMNHYVRLFDRRKGRLGDMPIHAAPEIDGVVRKLDAPFVHYGEPDIHTKVAKVNHYSTGLVADKVARGVRPSPWTMLWYPPLFFIRVYLLKRNFMNGWAGFIASVVSAFYAFLKYAKLYERSRAEAAAGEDGAKAPIPSRER